ncbi:hypothetical protein OG394_32590 [Kribbella sp. NBC_01245]|uniref:hypothetical protein n=1 Tax=Kribbella sp. NBC_01245 TaxID=2903578 RepID=UPI002E281947|nr:hypothetical protein [Kribbella sp. NBC_01245]
MRGSRWVRAWAGAGLALALVATGAMPAGARVEADAPGTVDVNRIPSRQPEIAVLGASPAGVLYRVTRIGHPLDAGPGTFLKPTGKPAYKVPDEYQNLAGDKIYAQLADVTKYLLIGTTTERTCPAALRAAYPYGGATGSPFTSFGWLSHSNQRVTADATGCRATGAIAPIGKYKIAAADATGYVTIDSEDINGYMTLGYRSYATPGTSQPIQTGGYNRHVYGLDLEGSVITWAHHDYADSERKNSYVIRSSTTGGAAKVTTVPRHVDSTAINGSAVGWAACNWSEITRCTAGSISSTGVITQVLDSRTVASDGTRFFVDTYGVSPGVDSATVIDGKSWTRVVTVGLLPPFTHGVDVAAGNVAYVDDQGPGGDTLTRRPFTKSGSTLTLGAQQVLGAIGDRQLTRDGDRTAYLDAVRDLWITTDGGFKTRVFDSNEKVSVAWIGSGAPFTLSGHRLLWVRGDYTGEDCGPWGCAPIYGKARLMAFDIRTGKNVDLGATTLTRPAALWGNYLVTTDSTNRILRKDLSSGAVVQVKAAGPRVTGLDVNGSIVGWSTCATVGTDVCGVSKIGYKIMSSSAPAVELTSLHSAKVALSGGHLAYTLDSNDKYTLKTWRLGTTTTTVIGSAYGFGLAPAFVSTVPFDMHDETLAWIGIDRTARLTPTAAFTARPRYLGNASGAASFSPSAGQRWSPAFPISKALPTCAITIKSGTVLKRSLPCATSIGIARASWDGKDAAGRLVAKGKYTWTITGSDADGGLLWWNGSANPISGTVTVG